MKSHTHFRLLACLLLLSTLNFSSTLFAQDTFDEFPWLNDIVDVNDCCQNQSITVYQSGIFQFIYIERGEECSDIGNSLYFQNGDFYCADLNGMDCRAAYQLTEENAQVLWTCEPAKATLCENVLETEWIQEFLESDCTGKIYSFEYKGESLVYISTLCACVDASDLVLNCEGIDVCFIGFADETTSCNPDIRENISEENLIWSPECDCECPIDFTPVCGVDGNTYETACEATCAGIEIMDRKECEVSISCTALDNLNINSSFCDNCISEVAIYLYEDEYYLVTLGDDKACSDAITIVMHCDSTLAFCYQGGFAGFNQCTKFFESAVKVETKWSKEKDCNDKPIIIAEPCTDLKNVDFGKCEAIMGIGLRDGKCTTISGCLEYVVDGVDYSEVFFPTVEICEQTCGINQPEPEKDTAALFFETYPWLTDVVDPNNCEGTNIEVYDLGSYQFLFVTTPESGQLFYEDGTFYCLDAPGYDCRSLYNLNPEQISERWICGEGRTTPAPKDGQWNSNTTLNTNTRTTFNAFPNPTSGRVNVAIAPNATQKQWLTVYNLYGQQIEQIEITAHKGAASYFFDLSNEDAGVYFVEWKTETDKKVQKVIRQ